MNKLLVVIDMQNDFIDGELGTPEAQAIVPKVVEKIKNWDEEIAITRDTHDDNYLNTQEGKNLPIEHCIYNTKGHKLNSDIKDALNGKAFYAYNKSTFGSIILADIIQRNEYDYIELIGLCTDICVVSNTLLIKAFNPNVEIVVDASCCAGTTPDKHEAALSVMESCQIRIINRGK